MNNKLNPIGFKDFRANSAINITKEGSKNLNPDKKLQEVIEKDKGFEGDVIEIIDTDSYSDSEIISIQDSEPEN